MNPTKRLESRRHFFKFLAGSPLLALAYPSLAEGWQQMLPQEQATKICPECGQVMAIGGSRLAAAAQQAAGSKPPAGTKPRGAVPEPPAVVEDPDRFLEWQLNGQIVKSAKDAVNVWDFEKTLHSTNLPHHWAYLHMGVNDFETRRANREGFQRLQLVPKRILKDVSKIDMSTTLFGHKWNSPLFLCPVAALQAYHTDGEGGAGKAAKAKNIMQAQSHVSSQSYEQILTARGGDPHWFQLYSVADWNVNKFVIDRVEKLGCPALIWTIDNQPAGSNRELGQRYGRAQGNEFCESCHNHKPGYVGAMRETKGLAPGGPRYPFTWDFVKRLKDSTKMKVLLKGINTAEDAERALENGADGIYVSNHGGRAEASNLAAIESLPEVAAAVKGRVPILFDSGVRRGLDIYKALALGATAVGIGRPYVWGLGAFGSEGVERVIDMLHAELQLSMRHGMALAINEIEASTVRMGPNPVMMRGDRLGFGL